MSETRLFNDPAIQRETGTALFSPCRRFRYTLTRTWGSGSTVNFIMLNPSTATAEANDPTVSRCIRWAKGHGFGSLVVTNIFAYRATDPRELLRTEDPIGPDNDMHLHIRAAMAEMVICAWGNHGKGRAADVLRWMGSIPLHCLRVTKAGQPSHPLYLPSGLEVIPFEVA